MIQKTIAWLAISVGIVFGTGFARAGNSYWQQHVGYSISVTLLDSIHTLVGSSSVYYSNNSPDTLRSVYFHLYYNAFKPGSMMDERSRAIQSRPVTDRIKKLPPDEWGNYDVGTVTSQGSSLKTTVFGTILRVDLKEPLLPGASIEITVPFREQIPRVIRRGGWMTDEGIEYSMSQWYPKVAEYDNEGWQIQEYIAREFYGVWGEFQVSLTLPSRFVVGATGECTNRSEVGHGYDLIAKGQKEGLVMPNPNAQGMTTWHFHANPVHDFAWVADDDYVHQWSTMQDTITLHSFYKTSCTKLWKNSLDYAHRIIDIYDTLYGPFVYRNFSVAMAGDGGMEYPQLIMITGYRPEMSLAGVMAHEIAHQWFYGMLGSNESREAFMDEGFTSFATTECMVRMFGRYSRLPNQQDSWLDWFLPRFDNKTDNYRGYQSYAASGYEEPLDIPHDWFREDIGAGQVYGKTEAILYMLQYTLGNDVFALGMKNYYMKWRLKHPHLADFQKVMEETANTDLDWFFDEWFKTTRTVDYDARGVSSDKIGDTIKTTIHIKNNGLAVMPLDLTLHYSDGTTAEATIPMASNQHNGYRKPDSTRMFLPDWDWVSPRYHATFDTPKEVSWFEIDTSMRLQDLNRANNLSESFPFMHEMRVDWAVWKQLFINPPMDANYAVVRPIVTYDQLSGINAGIGINHGFYLLGNGDAKLIWKQKPLRKESDGTSSVPRWYDYLDGSATSTYSLRNIDRLTSATYLLSKMDGISTAAVSISKEIRPMYLTLGPTQIVSGYLEAQDHLNYEYPYYHSMWSLGKTRVAGVKYSFASEKGGTKFDAFAENSFWNSDYTFDRIRARLTEHISISSDFPLALRVVGGTGQGNIPVERLWNLGMANPYEEQQDAFDRAVTDIDSSFDRKIGAFIEGGAGARGYAIPNIDQSNGANSKIRQTIGKNMLGASADIGIPNPIASTGRFARGFGFVVFGDAGWINNGNPSLLSDLAKNINTDAGVGVKVDWLTWFPYQLHGVIGEYAKIPTLVLYLPLYLNHPLDNTKPIAFRWRLALGTTF